MPLPTESVAAASRSILRSSLLHVPSHRNLTAFSTVTVVIILSFILPKAYRDYRIFKSYGPGGVPYNVFGWLIVRCIFCSFGREVFSTSEYDWRIAAGESQSFLTLTEEQLHARKADGRPVVGPHPVPQRQLTQIPDETVKQVQHSEQ